MVDFQHDRLLFSGKVDRGGAVIGSGAAPTGTQPPSKRYTGDQPHRPIIAAPRVACRFGMDAGSAQASGNRTWTPVVDIAYSIWSRTLVYFE
jgi:hypothetical protein